MSSSPLHPLVKALPPRPEIIKEFWHRGNLTYKLHKGQRKIQEILQNLPGQLRVINCSRQFGKTYMFVSRAISLCIRKKGAKVKIGTAFLTDLSEILIPSFEAVLSDCPPSLRPKYQPSKTKYIFPNGSEIKLVGLDKNPNGLRGQVPDLIIIEEAGFVNNLDYLYKSVLVPATTHRPDCEIILVSTPPSTPAHPFVDFAQRAELEGAYAKFTIYDNPMVSQETIDRLAKESGGYDSTTFRREYLAEFILDDDLALVKEWKDEYSYIEPKDAYYNLYHKYVGMDLGRKDFTALVFGYYHFKKGALVIEDEVLLKGSTWTTLTLKDEIFKKEKELWAHPEDDLGAFKPFRRISDNNNPHLILDLSSIHSCYFAETNKESLEAMVNEVRLMVNQGQIIIHPRCKMLIGSLKYGVWDNKRKEFAHSKIYGHFDFFAALMYLVRNLSKSTNPIPADFGFQNHTAWLGNVKEQVKTTANQRTLQKALIPRINKPKIV